MSPLQHVGLTAEQVRRMTCNTIKTPRQYSNPAGRGTMKRTVPLWIVDWLQSIPKDRKFTLSDIMAANRKIRGTAQTAISIAIKHGLAVILSNGRGGQGVTRFERTKLRLKAQPCDGDALTKIRAMKAGESTDYTQIEADSKQAAINILKRAEKAGMLVRREKTKVETVYRRAAK